MDKPMKINIIGILYLIGGVGVLGLAILIPILNTAVLDIFNMVLPAGGFNAGDVFISTTSLYHGAYFVLPMAYITGPISIIAGYLLLNTDKKLGWYLTFAASILYCLVLIGLVADIIMLQDDVRDIYTS